MYSISMLMGLYRQAINVYLNVGTVYDNAQGFQHGNEIF